MAGDKKRLRQLRRDNAARWEKVKELFRSLPEPGANPSPFAHQTLADRLQIELDLLPRSRWAVESDRILRDELLLRAPVVDGRPSSSPSATNFDALAAEAVQSYRTARQLVAQLREDVAEEEYRLREAHDALQEAKELRSELESDVAETERTAQRQVELELSLLLHGGVSEDDDNDSHQQHHRPSALGSAPHGNGRLQRQTEQLQSDLQYVCQCIEQQLGRNRRPARRKSDTEDPDDQPWSLETLVNELVSNLLRSPMNAPSSPSHSQLDLARTTTRSRSRSESWSDYPYLSTEQNPVQPQHVEFLKRSDLVEAHEHDDTLIRLLDYRR